MEALPVMRVWDHEEQMKVGLSIKIQTEFPCFIGVFKDKSRWTTNTPLSSMPAGMVKRHGRSAGNLH